MMVVCKSSWVFVELKFVDHRFDTQFLKILIYLNITILISTCIHIFGVLGFKSNYATVKYWYFFPFNLQKLSTWIRVYHFITIWISIDIWAGGISKWITDVILFFNLKLSRAWLQNFDVLIFGQLKQGTQCCQLLLF